MPTVVMWLEREENHGSAKCSKFVMASKTATAIVAMTPSSSLPKKVAPTFKFLEWSWKLGRTNRSGLTSGAFIRRQLHRL